MASGQPLDGLRILVVDDNDDARELTALTLQIAGACVAMAASVSHAISLLARGWDAVVTDIGMPCLSGYDLIGELRQRGNDVPVIALTGFDTPEHRRRLLGSGFACHLTKPVAPERLIGAVAASARDTTVSSPTSPVDVPFDADHGSSRVVENRPETPHETVLLPISAPAETTPKRRLGDSPRSDRTM